MFPRSFMNFGDDPFFNAQQEHMRDMNRMMNGFGGFARPFGSPFGMLEGPQDHRNGERSMVPQHGGFMGGFDSMFGNMNSMMSHMHGNFDNMASNPGGYSFSSSKVMTYSNDGRGEPKYYEASSSTKTAPGGVKETQKTIRDSESGFHKMAVGHHIGERGHVVEKSRNTRTEDEEQKQDFFNIDENDAEHFDREWKEKTKGFHNGLNKISGLNDDRRKHGGEKRSRVTPALEHRSDHREREGRERNHARGRERKHAVENHDQKNKKKVHIAQEESHL